MDASSPEAHRPYAAPLEAEPAAPLDSLDVFRDALRPLASLKLTVILFALSIFLVFAGTLAQVDMDIWEVIGGYFRTWWAWIDLQIFFPRSIVVPFGFYFPGGWALGALLSSNLIAAHLLRFKLQASGPRLTVGALVLAAGAALAWLVVAAGSSDDGTLRARSVDYKMLWLCFKVGLGVVWLAGAAALALLDRRRTLELILLGSLLAGLGGLLAWLVANPDAKLGDSSMRILWQLIQGGIASLVMLAGCVLMFRKRAGIVLLHIGIGLMMVNELYVGLTAVEAQMRIPEGATINYVEDIRELELAVIDTSDPREDDVVVVPGALLVAGDPIEHELLPFDIEVAEFFPNSDIRRIKPDEKNRATAGAGLDWIAEERRVAAGTDTGGSVDTPSAYLKLTDRESGASLGTRLATMLLVSPERVTVGDVTYDVALRFKRNYKPYSVHLVDVRFDKYLGTRKAKNYSSDVRLVDSTRNVDREVKIWMNNPLRFAGETFYQSEFFADPRSGEETTTLQVVTNRGWMIPYVGCMIVAVGMLAHFLVVLVRFLKQRSSMPRVELEVGGVADWLVPLVVVLIFAAWLASQARPPSAPPEGIDREAFGQLPVVYQGRVKPYDTLARNSLRVLSDRQEYVDANGDRQPAIRWLLDVIADNEAAGKHRVFRIDNLEVLQTLGLERRKRFRYALDEFREQIDELDRQAALATRLDPKERSLYQRSVLHVAEKLQLYLALREAHALPAVRPDHVAEDLMAQFQQNQQLARFTLAHGVPPAPDDADGEWQPFITAATKAMAQRVIGQEPNPHAVVMFEALLAYRGEEAAAFNGAVAEYATLLDAEPPSEFDADKVRFETFFNHFAPFYHAAVLYVVAFVLAALSWLGWSRPLGRAAFWLVVLTLAVHTFALVARVYISGRPPVTNLYSSAVFIGWGCVVIGLGFEVVHRLGVGTIVAATSGFATLLIAHFLASGGDTFEVLQAVLDTQFWLATHVVCITLGYATTLVAGLLGVIFILRGMLTSSLIADYRRSLARMIYGTVCFGILFSFVGTVLGGLWADDSWGRFWGWDPKENGALIIVLWNALVLHARWGGMVRERGLAALAVVGNIVTAWSWFGVNELGVGLHSYGFTDGTRFWLGLFWLVNLALVLAAAALPRESWPSYRADSEETDDGPLRTVPG